MPQRPIAQLRVYNPADLFGEVTYPGDACTFDLLGPGVTATGLCRDPTGTYLMQMPADLWLPADETQWTTTGGTFGHGTDEVTGVAYLRSTDPTGPFAATFNHTFADNDGFKLVLPRFAAPLTSGGATVNPSLISFYVALNAGASGDLYRLAVQPGQPIRLQKAAAGTTAWADVPQGIAHELGESEGYLNRCAPQRWLTVDVLPQCDPAWATGGTTGQPGNITQGGPPPGRLVITLGGGDAVLTIPMTTFHGGQIAVTGQYGQWGCRVAKKGFYPTATAAPPTGVRPDPFQGTASAFLTGYLPYADMASVAVTVSDGTAPADTNTDQVVAGNQATAALTLTTPTEGQTSYNSTTYALRSCYISAIEAEWPVVQTPPLADPPFVAYTPVYAVCTSEYDQGTGWVRRHAVCVFRSLTDTYAPGSVLPAVRGAVLLMGDQADGALTPVITGLTALAHLDGQAWDWVDWQRDFALSVEDRHRTGDPDQAPCLHVAPYDFEAHYTPVREMHYRMNFTDDWMTGFPHVHRGGALDGGGTFGGYYLGGGTAAEPRWQPAADTPINSFLGEIRGVAGELDAGSGQVLPMILGTDPAGNVVYAPLPALIALAWLAPETAAAAALAASVRDYLLRDFLKGCLRTTATLSHIRTPIVLEGLDRTTGQVLLGVAANEKLGVGADADPATPGYIGRRVPYVHISRLYDSPATIQTAAAAAAVQLAFPAVGMAGDGAALEPARDVMQVVSLTDAYTTGNPGPVPFWTDRVTHVVDWRNVDGHVGETSVHARLLGRAAA